MTSVSESGRYSLAGFLYQVAATAVHGFNVWEHDENDDEILQVLELEGMGQDLVAKPVAGGKATMIQYKHSTKNRDVDPSELRDILATFLKCVRAAEKSVSDFDYNLTTNRDLHPDIDAWSGASDKDELESCIKRRARSEIEDLDELCEIFGRFSHQKLTEQQLDNELNNAASKLGILEEEKAGGVNRLMGFLAKRSDDAGSRRILPSEIRRELAGHPNACELLSQESTDIRVKEIKDFQNNELFKPAGSTESPVITRKHIQEINTAVRTYPVTVVYGDGGCGKSIAVADATIGCMQDPAQPPKFCMVERANAFTAQSAITKIAGWRRCSRHADGNVFSNALRRLFGVSDTPPVLTVGVDAIDENLSAALNNENLSILLEVIRLAAESHAEKNVPDLSLVITCRRKEEFTEIFRKNSFVEDNAVIYIPISDFDNEELLKATQVFSKVNTDVRSRIAHHLDADELIGIDFNSDSFGVVSDDVLTIIRHPVLWFVFSELDEATQHECLDGNPKSLFKLGNTYLEWFRKKAASRIPQLQRNECEEALKAAALSFLEPGDVGTLNGEWLKPVQTASGNSTLRAKNLFQEAVSAGLVLEVDTREKTWRWRHPWFCSFLRQLDGGAN